MEITRQSDGLEPRSDHPWHGFAHPELGGEELERLQRTLRYAFIELNKLWVEVQSIPSFLNTLGSASVQQLEGIIGWLQASPSWEEFSQCRLVPDLAYPPTRRVLVTFHKEVQCLRALRESLSPRLTRVPSGPEELRRFVAFAAEARELSQGQGVVEWTRPKFSGGITEAKDAVERVVRIREFFHRLSLGAGAPAPMDPAEAQKVLDGLETLCQLETPLKPWRLSLVVGAGEQARIEEWQARARPILEARLALKAHFNLAEPVGPETLERIADEIARAGLFRAFKSTYKDALEAYEGLLLPLAPNEKKRPKESRKRKAERLRQWATLLTQEAEYDSKAEGREIFGEGFAGVDTDFASALEAHAWASRIRERFSGPVAEFILTVHGERLESALQLGASDDRREVLELLGARAQAQSQGADESGASGAIGSESFGEAETRCRQRLESLVRLDQILGAFGLRDELQLTAMPEICGLAEEMLFLTERMESNASLRNMLKQDYRGADTDLKPIEQGLSFVKFIQLAPISVDLKQVFLAPHGVQRLKDSRKAVEQPLPWFGIVHERFRRLEQATRGQVRTLAGDRGLEELPVPELLERIQNALKHQGMLPDYVRLLNT